MNRTDELEFMNVKKVVIKLCIPAVLAQLINFLYNLVDRIYVANIPSIGTISLAALGIVLPITIIIASFAQWLGMGGAPLASIMLGKDDKVKANEIFNTSFLLLLGIGIVLTILTFSLSEPLVRLFGCPDEGLGYADQYLKIYSLGSIFVLLSLGLNCFITSQGESFYSMMSILIGAILNIILDPIFIYGLKMGVGGAALATIISQFISFVWILRFFFLRRSLYHISLKFNLDWSVVRRILILGLSPFIMQVTESAIQIVFNINLKWYSQGNADYTATMTILLSALQLSSLPLNGLGYGIQPFVSYNYGRKNNARIKEGLRFISTISLVYAVVFWLVSLVFPQIYGYLFSASPQVNLLIKEYAPLFLFGTIMFFAQMTLQNVNVALGQAKVAIFLAILRKVVLLIPLTFTLPIFLGVKGVFLSEGIADLIAGITTFTMIVLTIPKLLNKNI